MNKCWTKSPVRTFVSPTVPALTDGRSVSDREKPACAVSSSADVNSWAISRPPLWTVVRLTSLKIGVSKSPRSSSNANPSTGPPISETSGASSAYESRRSARVRCRAFGCTSSVLRTDRYSSSLKSPNRSKRSYVG